MKQGFNFTGFMQTQLTAIFPFRLTLGLMLMLSAFSGQGQTLGQALNAPELTWTTSGTGGVGWSVENTAFFTHDGVSAARSFAGPFQNFTLQTTVTGPGKITFWWNDNLSSSTLSFTVNGVLVTNTYQWGFWRKETFFLGAGSQTLRWINTGTNVGSPAQTVYLDEVNYEPGTFAPEIMVQPLAQSQVEGLDAMFSAVAQGTAPLSYQWQFDGVAIAYATNSSLIVSNIQSVNLGNYRLIVTNVVGAVTSSVAVLEFGSVAAWGQINPVGWATATNGLTDVIGIAAGVAHNLALNEDGSVLGWGNDFIDELQIPADLTNVVSVAANSGNSMALLPNEKVVSWGAAGFGITGITNVPPDLTNVVAISLGQAHALALKADGTVVSWGISSSGQTNVPSGLSNVVAIAAGRSHSLALKADGTIVAWGYSSFGVTSVPASLTNAVAIAGGDRFSVALKSDGTLQTWGMTGNSSFPGQHSNVAIAAGYGHVVALRADGIVKAWGGNNYGQTNVPPNLTNVVAISAGGDHALALVGDGPPVTSALMSQSKYTPTGFKVTVPSQSGRVYRLEYKNSPADAEWTPLPLVAGTGKDLVLTDAMATADSQRFYRVRRW